MDEALFITINTSKSINTKYKTLFFKSKTIKINRFVINVFLHLLSKEIASLWFCFLNSFLSPRISRSFVGSFFV